MIEGKKERHDPTYIQKRRETERQQRERQQHEDNRGAISRIVDALNATQTQEQTDDDKRALREKVTIGLLVATVIVAGIGDVIFYRTMKDARI